MSWSYDFLDSLYSAYREAVGKKPKLERQILSALHQIGVFNIDGGPGSGNWGHEGRPGEVGGSVEGGGVHNRQTTANGSYTSFSKKRKSLATPHEFGADDLEALRKEGTVLLVDGKKFNVHYCSEKEITLAGESGGYYRERVFYGKTVQTVVSSKENPNYSIMRERTISKLRSQFEKAYRSETDVDADEKYRSKTGEVWKGLDSKARRALVDYTGNYYKEVNGTLRGLWNYLQPDSKTRERINAITNAIEKTKFDEDTVLYRGVGTYAFEEMFGLPAWTLKPNNLHLQSLVGRTGTELGFLSCGTAKDTGFTDQDVQIEILCPTGTQAMYVEPFSKNGKGDPKWNGESSQTHFGREMETIVQQGSRLTILSADYVEEKDQYHIKAAIMSQKPQKY